MNRRKRKRSWTLLVTAGCIGLGTYAWFHLDGHQHARLQSNLEATDATASPISNTTQQTANVPARAQLQTMKTQMRQAAQLQQQLAVTYKKGKALFFQRDYTQAIQLEDQVIEQDPSYYKAYNLKGIALCFSGHYASGMADINRALSMAPNYDYANFNKGLALELYAHYDAALQAYHETIPLARPTWKMWSYYGIAAIYGRRGDVKDTIDYLKLAIAMDPKGVKSAARTESDFNNVRQSAAFQALLK